MLPAGLDTELAIVDELLLRLVARAEHTELPDLLGALAAAHRPGELRVIGDGELPRAELALPPVTSPLVHRMLRAWNLAEIDRLLVALAPELEPRYSSVFAALSGADAVGRPTLAFAHELVRARTGETTPIAERFTREHPLGRLPIVELAGSGPLPMRSLALEPAVLALLLGSHSGDARWRVEPTEAHRTGEDDPATAWMRARPTCLVAIHGPAGTGRFDRARDLASAVAMPTLSLDADTLTADMLPALARDALWHEAAIAIRDITPGSQMLVRALAELTPSTIFVTGDASLPGALDVTRPILDVHHEPPARDARARRWSHELARHGLTIESPAIVEQLAELFALTRDSMAAAIRIAAERATLEQRPPNLVEAVRTVTRSRIGDVATRLSPAATETLIVPRDVRRELDLAVMWMQRASSVDAVLDLPERHLSCLFHGPPGTGKTLAARVLATRIGVDAFRIDLSQIVSKYVGETEKNLARVFDAAEAAHALLFFDEADALFAKRTEVHTANDRFANIESGYLLQRLEAHRGPVILATNLVRNIEPAMMRRLQIVIEFPMPSVGERLAMWQRYAARRHDDVDLAWLAEKFALSGAGIRDAAMTATVLAGGGPPAMRELVVAVWREMRRSGRMVEPRELGPWVDVIRDYIDPRSES